MGRDESKPTRRTGIYGNQGSSYYNAYQVTAFKMQVTGLPETSPSFSSSLVYAHASPAPFNRMHVHDNY